MKYDWQARARARLMGEKLLILVGDLDLGLTKHVCVTDDFGRWVGTSKIYEVYA